MSRITWDQVGSRTYEVGVDRGVLYSDVGGEYTNGVAWNGLTDVELESDGGDGTPLYSGDVKVDILRGNDDVTGSISAYTYPDEFEPCLGSVLTVPGIFVQNQGKDRFGFSYRTLIGNDVDGQEHGYKIHLIYSAEITGVSKSSRTISESIDDVEMSWDFDTIPKVTEGYDPYTEVVVDSTKISPEFLEQFENIIYGTDEEPARLPSLEELMELFYVEPPIPEDYEGYPHDRLYPREDLYPYPIPNPEPDPEDEGGE